MSLLCLGSQMSSGMPPKILVVGAGVNGLASALCIQKCCPHAQVEIVADTFSPHTTSDGSAGLWLPVIFGDTDTEVLRKHCKATHDYLQDLAYSPLAGEVGVQLLSGYQICSDDTELPEPQFVKDIVNGFRKLTPGELTRFPMASKYRVGEDHNVVWFHIAVYELPAQIKKLGERSGCFFTTVQVDVTPYLQWLMRRFSENGGRVFCRKLSSLTELAGQYDLVINCCGLGARDLVKDDQVSPTRGQLWRVHAPWIKHFYMFKPKPGLESTYVLPGVNNVVVGGTAQVGDWRTNIDEENSFNIWKRAQNILPPISKATPIRAWAGLRPSRTTLRLEKEVLDVEGKKLKVVHNYGHGGSGITLHWGCALEVTQLALESLGFPSTAIKQLAKSRM